MRTTKPTAQYIFRNQWLFGIALFALAPLAHGDYPTAVRAYQNKDYEKAYVEYRNLAELGHTDSQYAIGYMYHLGQGVTQNDMLAYGWIRLAADAGNAPAKALEPRIRAEMDEESVERARSILDRYSPFALQSRLLPRVIEDCEYCNAIPPQHSFGTMPEYPASALSRGISGFVVLEFLIAADGTVRDMRVIDAFPTGFFESSARAVASKWKFDPAVRDGKPFSTWAESCVIYKIAGFPPLTNKSAQRLAKLQDLAELGDPNAQFVYGLLLAGHPQLSKPWSEVLPRMIRAAQGGSAAAQFRVAQSLLRGRGCESDSAKAKEWLLRSAQQDFPDAQVDLGRLALMTGANYDPKQGVFWLERAAQGNSIKSKKYLAAVLAASPEESLRDAPRALALADAVLKEERGDTLAHEVRAAALASLGKFTVAAVAQTEALKLAKKRGWNLAEIKQRLATYQSGKPWYGDLLTF
jgi:TonB family protein